MSINSKNMHSARARQRIRFAVSKSASMDTFWFIIRVENIEIIGRRHAKEIFQSKISGNALRIGDIVSALKPKGLYHWPLNLYFYSDALIISREILQWGFRIRCWWASIRPRLRPWSYSHCSIPAVGCYRRYHITNLFHQRREGRNLRTTENRFQPRWRSKECKWDQWECWLQQPRRGHRGPRYQPASWSSGLTRSNESHRCCIG